MHNLQMSLAVQAPKLGTIKSAIHVDLLTTRASELHRFIGFTQVLNKIHLQVLEIHDVHNYKTF